MLWRIPFRASLASSNFPDRFLRHKDFLGELTQITTDLDKADATFIITNALNGLGSRYVSLASVNLPGFWLRHQDFRIKLHKLPVPDVGPPPPETPELRQFRDDATFMMEDIGGIDVNSQGFYTVQKFFVQKLNREVRFLIRHKDFHVFVDVFDPDHRLDFNWQIVDPLAPEPWVEPH